MIKCQMHCNNKCVYHDMAIAQLHCIDWKLEAYSYMIVSVINTKILFIKTMAYDRQCITIIALH